jgi:hypothetical protein
MRRGRRLRQGIDRITDAGNACARASCVLPGAAAGFLALPDAKAARWNKKLDRPPRTEPRAADDDGQSAGEQDPAAGFGHGRRGSVQAEDAQASGVADVDDLEGEVAF